MVLLQQGIKRINPVKSADIEIKSYIGAPVYLPGYQCQMDPRIFGLKRISADHGRDVRISEISMRNTLPTCNINNMVYRTIQDPATLKMYSKFHISKIPIPITISTYNSDHDYTGDLGGIADGLLPGPNDDDFHKRVVTSLTNTESVIQSNMEYNGYPNMSVCLRPLTGRHIVVDSTGIWWITWCMKDGTVNHVYFGFSIDAGKTWTVDLLDNGFAGNQVCANCVSDKNDTIHFVWCQEGLAGDTSNAIMYRNVTSTGVWSAPVAISINPNPSGYWQTYPSQQVKKDGLSIGVAWSAVGVSGYYDVMFRERNDIGVWGAIDPVTTATIRNFLEPSLDYDLNDKPHIVMAYVNAGVDILPADIYHTTNSGAGWSALTLINTECVDRAGAVGNIIIDILGTTHLQYHLVYADGVGRYHYDLIYKQISSAGVLSTAITIDTDISRYCTKQVDYRRNVYFAYGALRGSVYLGLYRIKYGR